MIDQPNRVFIRRSGCVFLTIQGTPASTRFHFSMHVSYSSLSPQTLSRVLSLFHSHTHAHAHTHTHTHKRKNTLSLSLYPSHPLYFSFRVSLSRSPPPLSPPFPLFIPTCFFPAVSLFLSLSLFPFRSCPFFYFSLSRKNSAYTPHTHNTHTHKHTQTHTHKHTHFLFSYVCRFHVMAISHSFVFLT